tara:strand:+ start:398 stop:1432 length:1035 start_codon:yes stop_codon:yes gene_type:complete
MDKLVELIKYSSEGHSLDFKKEQYPLGKHAKKHELIKDLIAMANHPSDEDKYIILGVKEKDGIADTFFPISELTDEAKYQQLISINVIPKLKFEYKAFEYQGNKLAYFRIFGNSNRPYLLSKNLFNTLEPSKNEFRVGDGFIRIGSSSEKMGRTEFDEIYKTKYQKQDRKSSLNIEAYFEVSSNPKIYELDLKYLDIRIENLSNKSIDLDVEMKVGKGNNFHLMSERDIWDELRRKNLKGLGAYNASFQSISAQISDSPPISFCTNIEENDSYLIISRSKMKFEKTAIRLSQSDFEKDVFCQNLFVLCEQPTKIDIEVIIRSDDFTEGPFLKKFEVNSPTNVFF